MIKCPTKPTKSEYNAHYREAERMEELRELAETYRTSIDLERIRGNNPHFDIGFSSRRLYSNGLFGKELPIEFNFLMNRLKAFIKTPKTLAGLFHPLGATNNIRCRENATMVLAAMLVYSNMLDGKVGIPGEDGIQTVTWWEIRKEVALRFGKVMCEKVFYRTVKLLKNVGYVATRTITGTDGDRILSCASYKQFTPKFLNDVGAHDPKQKMSVGRGKKAKYESITSLIEKTRQRALASGLKFHWMKYRILISLKFHELKTDKAEQIATACGMNLVSRNHNVMHSSPS